jgi:hypothetical protein
MARSSVSCQDARGNRHTESSQCPLHLYCSSPIETATNAALLDAARTRALRGSVQFHLVMPATPQRLHRVVDPEVAARQAALERLARAFPLLSDVAATRGRCQPARRGSGCGQSPWLRRDHCLHAPAAVIALVARRSAEQALRLGNPGAPRDRLGDRTGRPPSCRRCVSPRSTALA